MNIEIKIDGAPYPAVYIPGEDRILIWLPHKKFPSTTAKAVVYSADKLKRFMKKVMKYGDDGKNCAGQVA